MWDPICISGGHLCTAWEDAAARAPGYPHGTYTPSLRLRTKPIPSTSKTQCPGDWAGGWSPHNGEDGGLGPYR